MAGQNVQGGLLLYSICEKNETDAITAIVADAIMITRIFTWVVFMQYHLKNRRSFLLVFANDLL